MGFFSGFKAFIDVLKVVDPGVPALQPDAQGWLRPFREVDVWLNVSEFKRPLQLDRTNGSLCVSDQRSDVVISQVDSEPGSLDTSEQRQATADAFRKVMCEDLRRVAIEAVAPADAACASTVFSGTTGTLDVFWAFIVHQTGALTIAACTPSGSTTHEGMVTLCRRLVSDARTGQPSGK